MDLSGRTVLITGAARGIGADSARKLAARGARVALVGLEPEELRRVSEQCGPQAAAFDADVTDRDGLQRAVDDAAAHFGGIDVVVANAGVAPTGMMRSMDPDSFERTIEVNLLGVWRTVRACLPHVVERRGYVLVIASLAAAAHGPGMGAYAASKAGAEAFANSLRQELAHLGVDVGVGYFSFIDTDMVRSGDAHPVFGGLRSRLPAPFAKTYPLSDVGDAIADGVQGRRRTVVVPGWVRILLALRGVLGPLTERGSRAQVAEIDAAFQRDVEQRGMEVASAPVGPGGAAAGVRRGEAVAEHSTP